MSRNYPPAEGIRVPHAAMLSFVEAAFAKAGMSREHAELMAGLLVGNDLRCIFSHGTQQVPPYVGHLLEGRVNPDPELTVESDATVTTVVDGDGGLGYLACLRATELSIEKASAHGVAAAITRNHHHFGAASIYTRMALEADCIGMAISSHRHDLDPDELILNAGSGPISIATPAGEQPDLILDGGSGFVPFAEEFYERFPSAYFKTLGLRATCRALGGVLSGIYEPRYQPPQSPWESNQGTFIAVFHVGHFMDVGDFKTEMDRFVAAARAMRPAPGMDESLLPGGPEYYWERVNEERGIPYGDEHLQMLDEVAERLGLKTPFAEFAVSRFSATGFGA